jgi:hypothetical protein
VDTGHTHERWRGQVLHAPRRRRRRHRRLRVVNGRALELEQQLLGDARDGLVLGAHSDRPEPVQNGCAGRSASVGRRGAAVSRAIGIQECSVESELCTNEPSMYSITNLACCCQPPGM